MATSTYPTIQCGIGNRDKFDTISISEAKVPSIGCRAVHDGYWIIIDDSLIAINERLVSIAGWKEDVEYELDHNPTYPDDCYVTQLPIVFIPRDI